MAKIAVEGQFPKADGDILFASEANRFADSGFTVGTGSTQWGESGVLGAFADVGSYLIPAGKLTNPCSFRFMYNMESSSSRTSRFMLTVSGESNNGSVITRAAQATSELGEGYLLVGSPLSGVMYMDVMGIPPYLDDTSFRHSATFLPDLDTDEAVVFNLAVSTNGSGRVMHSINYFRSGAIG